MLELAIITLAILFFCGLPVGIPLAICAIIEAVMAMILGIVRSINKIDGNL